MPPNTPAKGESNAAAQPTGQASAGYSSSKFGLNQYRSPNDLSRIEMPSHWAVPWSDLMMVMMVMFAVMLATRLAEQDMREMFTPPQNAKENPSSATSREHTAQKKNPSPTADSGNQESQASAASSDQQTSNANQSAASSYYDGDNQAATTHAPQSEPFGTLSEPAQATGPSDASVQSDKINDAASLSPEEILRRSNQLIAQANLKDVDVALTDNNAVKVSVRGNLLFDLGKADLKADAVRFLNELSQIIAANNFMIEVVGHTDNFPVSNPAYPTNWELSSARAARVARYLIQTGRLEAGRFTVIGQSYYRPAAPNDSLANKAKNRRVEIIITRQEYMP